MGTIGEKISFLAVIFTMMSISSSPHPFILIICYALHELGHLTMAKCVGAGIGSLKKGGIRLSLSYDCSGISYFKETLVCAGGIIFNLFFALFAFLCGLKDTDGGNFFILCNISLALMNLYPVTILDGGGIVRTICMSLFSEGTAGKICKITSFVFALILWICAVYLQLVFSSNISLFLISVLLLTELCFSL